MNILKSSFNVMVMLLVFSFLVSCGGGSSEKIISSSNISLPREVRDIIKVVDGEYKITIGKEEIFTVIRFEVLKSGVPLRAYSTNTKLFCLDENDSQLKVGFLDGLSLDDNEDKKFSNVINESEGYTFAVRFSARLSAYTSKAVKQWKTNVDKSSSYNIDSIYIDTSTSTTTSSSSSTSSTSSSNWDNVLSEYEKFADDYIAAMKKASSGDLSSMTNAASLLERAERLSNQLERASGELTSSQSNKLIQIQTKIANAASSLF